MSLFRSRNFWSTLGLVLLGMAAVALSLAAIGFGSSTDTGAITEAPSYTVTESSEEASSPAATVEPESTGPETGSEETESEEEVENSNLTVVMGDSNSLGDIETIWLGSTMEELGWDSVQNLSAPGRGYVTVPRECVDSPCASFPGTVEAITEFQPDVVVTFGEWLMAMFQSPMLRLSTILVFAPRCQMFRSSPFHPSTQGKQFLIGHRFIANQFVSLLNLSEERLSMLVSRL